MFQNVGVLHCKISNSLGMRLIEIAPSLPKLYHFYFLCLGDLKLNNFFKKPIKIFFRFNFHQYKKHFLLSQGTKTLLYIKALKHYLITTMKTNYKYNKSMLVVANFQKRQFKPFYKVQIILRVLLYGMIKIFYLTKNLTKGAMQKY